MSDRAVGVRSDRAHRPYCGAGATSVGRSSARDFCSVINKQSNVTYTNMCGLTFKVVPYTVQV